MIVALSAKSVKSDFKAMKTNFRPKIIALSKLSDFLKMKQVKNSQIKSKKRVKRYAEVFTNEREVKAICDLAT